MLNYCIFIVIWAAVAVVNAAASLAIILARAYREAPAPPSAAIPNTAPADRVLAYAPVRAKQSIFRRFPQLAGVGAIIEFAVIANVSLTPAILAWSFSGVLRQYAIVAMGVGVLALTVACMVVWRGLRQANGVPTAANWPRRKLTIGWIVGVILCGLVLVILDAGTKSRMRRVRDEVSALSESLHVPVPAGTQNAADIYREAFVMYGADGSKVPDWSSRYSRLEDGPVAPPALSEELKQAVAVLHRAADQPVADWGIDPKTYSIVTPLAHLKDLRASANLLRIDAAREAQEGHVDAAIRDITTIRAIARHTAQGQTLVEGLVAIGVDSVAYAATEDVLPFANDERVLDGLVIQRDETQQHRRKRMFQGEGALSVRMMADIFDGKIANVAPVVAASPLNWFRVFLADTEIRATRAIYSDVAIAASYEPVRAIAEMRRIDAQLPIRARNSGILTSILMPSVGRAGMKAIEVEMLGELSNVGLAARRMYMRTGRLPSTPDELVSSGLLDRVPTDSFSGNPIRLAVKANEVVIYSVGADGRDDGGDHVRDKDITFRVGLKPLWEIDRATTQPTNDGIE